MDPMQAQLIIKAYWFERISELVTQNAALQKALAEANMKIAELEKAAEPPAPTH